MKLRILNIFALLTLLTACEGAFEASSDRDVESTDRDIEATIEESQASDKADSLDQPAPSTTVDMTGQELYVQHCGTCHGEDAMGAQAWPLSIQGYFPVYGVVKFGQGTMGAIDLTDDEIGSIQQFLLDVDM